MLECASFIATLDFDTLEGLFRIFMGDDSISLSESNRAYFGLTDDEAVSFNKEQRLAIVGHDVTPQIRQTVAFLRSKGLSVSCVEFTYFETTSKEQLLTTDIVDGREPLHAPITSVARGAPLSESQLLASAGAATAVFKALLALAGQDGMYLRWGTKSLAPDVGMGDRHIPLLYGYVPGVMNNTIYHVLHMDAAAISKKVRHGAELVADLSALPKQDPLWQPSGPIDMKSFVDHEFSDEEIARVVG